MTPKERLLSAIRGKKVDRVPWSPNLAYYWASLDEATRKRGQLPYFEEIGADPLMRGTHVLYGITRKNCNVREEVNGFEKMTIYETPVGTLQAKHVYSPVGHTWFLTDHPVKTENDFKVLIYLNENAVINPHFQKFTEDYNRLGERGLYLPLIGSERKTAFQKLLEYWVGTEELVYALADYPLVVEECLEAMRKNSVATVNISVQSPAEAFIFYDDTSTTNISPNYFKKYIAPEINEWGKIIHNADKCLIQHACEHLKDLIELMAYTEIDMIESISPPPTGNIELWDAREKLTEHIGLIGGIEPTVFLNSTVEQLEKYVIKLLNKLGNTRFILANSDSCPPGVELKKFKLITELVQQYAQ